LHRRRAIAYLERPWRFEKFARAGDYEGVFVLLEQIARDRLREQEMELLRQREERYAAARARGEEPVLEVDEHLLPFHTLSKKAKQRVRRLLLSDDPSSLRVMGTLPRVDLLDAFQSFCAVGHEVGMDYVWRRLQQIGLPFDEEIASRWMDGIIVAAMRRRNETVDKRIKEEQEKQAAIGHGQEQEQMGALEAGEKFIAAAAAKGHAAAVAHSGASPAAPAQSSATATPTTSNLRFPRERVTAGLSSRETSFLQASAATDPDSVVALRHTFAHVGLPSTRLVRPQVDTVLNWLQRYGLIPSRRVVVQVFEALSVDNDLHGALAFISRLARMKYYVSGFTYSLLIEALTKHQNSEGAMFVFLHMERARFAPHTATFNKLIQSFARLGDYTTAYRLLQDMQRHGLAPDNATFASLIAACAAGGRMDLALDMFEYFRKFHSRLMRAKHTHRIKDIKLLQAAGSSTSPVPHDTRELVPLTLGPAPFEALILAHLARGELHEAVSRLNEMVDLSVRPTRRIYSSLINFCVDVGRLNEARQMWEQSLQVGLVPNVPLYAAYMRTITPFAELQHLYAEITQGGQAHQQQQEAEAAGGATKAGGVVVSQPGSFHGPLQPNTFVFALLLAAMVRESRLDQLGWLLREMRSTRVLPTRPMRVLIRALLHKCERPLHASLYWRLVHARTEDALDDAMLALLVDGSDEEARVLLAELAQELKEKLAAQAAQAQGEADAAAHAAAAAAASEEAAAAEEAAALAEVQHAAPVQAAEYTMEYAEPTAADFPDGVRLSPQEEEENARQ